MKLPKGKSFPIEYRGKTYRVKRSDDVFEIFSKRVVHENELDILRSSISPFLKHRYQGRNLETMKDIFYNKLDNHMLILTQFQLMFPYKTKAQRRLDTLTKVVVLTALATAPFVINNIKERNNNQLELKLEYPEPQYYTLPLNPDEVSLPKESKKYSI